MILSTLKSLRLDHSSLSLGACVGMWTSFPPTRQVQFNCSQTNVSLVLITFTTDSTISFLEKAWVLTKTENKLKPVFHNREYNWPPWLVGWQSRIRIPSTWWNFLEHKRQPWSYTQGFWTAMYVTQYHYETVSQNSYLTLLGWRSFFYNWVECLNDLNRIMGTTRTVTLNAAKD